MSVRECGECTACCEGWVSDESLDMRAGKPCQHCTSSGCAIYDDRPQNPCKVFRCLWLDNIAEFPDDMRPDRSGVIVMSGRPWREWDVLQAVPVGPEIPPETLERLRLYTKQKDIPLVFYEREIVDGEYNGGGRQRAFGSQNFAHAVKNYVLPKDMMKL